MSDLPVSSTKPSKRPRLAPGTAYHDPVISTGDFTIIQSREGRLRKIGNDTLTAALPRTTEHAAGAWEEVEEWVTPDDPEFALDPNGAWYEEALEADVMTETSLPVPKKKKYKRSRVSVSPHLFWVKLFDSEFLKIEKTPCRLERELSTSLPR